MKPTRQQLFSMLCSVQLYEMSRLSRFFNDFRYRMERTFIGDRGNTCQPTEPSLLLFARAFERVLEIVFRS